MKITRLLQMMICWYVLSGVCAAQQPLPLPLLEEPPTKLEALLAETGTVLIRGHTRIGVMSGSRGTAYITAWEVVDLQAGHREQGISVEITDTGRPDAEERAYIDYDEIAPLLSGLDQIMKLDNQATKLARYEAQYRTKGGLLVTSFSSNSGFAAAISTGGGRRPRFVLRPSGLIEFRNLLESAKQTLDELSRP